MKHLTQVNPEMYKKKKLYLWVMEQIFSLFPDILETDNYPIYDKICKQ